MFFDNSQKTTLAATTAGVTQINNANLRLAANKTVPTAWGAWGGYFFCTDGTSLQFDPSNNTAFYCPSQKVYYTGEPYNKAWYTSRHNQLISWTADLAMGYYLTGNTSYADAAIDILVAYSIWYPAFPYRDINEQAGGSGGRMLSQTLDESNNTPLLCLAFDHVYDR